MIWVVTAPGLVPDEPSILRGLFSAGLETLLLRKPGWSADEYETLLQGLPLFYRNRVMLAGYPELVSRYGLKGLHLSERLRDGVSGLSDLRGLGFCVSTSVHAVDEVVQVVGGGGVNTLLEVADADRSGGGVNTLPRVEDGRRAGEGVNTLHHIAGVEHIREGVNTLHQVLDIGRSSEGVNTSCHITDADYTSEGINTSHHIAGVEHTREGVNALHQIVDIGRSSEGVNTSPLVADTSHTGKGVNTLHPITDVEPAEEGVNTSSYAKSTSCNSSNPTFNTIPVNPKDWDFLLLGPVFDSISKAGYKGRSFSRIPHNAIAIGGVTPSNIEKLREMGFCGAAMLGAIWQEPEQAVEVFIKAKASWK